MRISDWSSDVCSSDLTVIDDDAVDLSNLQRQVLFATADVGRPKADAAREAVARLTPDVTVAPVHQRITADNAETILSGADVVLDACHPFPTPLAVAETAARPNIPFISAPMSHFRLKGTRVRQDCNCKWQYQGA